MPSNRHRERCGNSCAQLGQRVDGVGRARAAHFAIVDDERRLVGHRRAHHGDAQRSIGQRAFAMRRIARRQEAHFGELQRLPQLEGGAQVPVVDRIEGSAEQADGPVAVRSIQAARFPVSGSVRRPANSTISSAISSQASPRCCPLIMRSAREMRAASRA